MCVVELHHNANVTCMACAMQGGAGAGGNQADGPKDGRRGPKGGKPEAEGEAGAARRKRRSEEQELDRIAEQGLNAKGGCGLWEPSALLPGL